MSLKALDELRGLRDEAASKMIDNPRWVCMRSEAIADAIEAELSERFMELPVGADGVPIHVGDKMEYIDCAQFMVCAVAPGVIHAWKETKLGEVKTTEAYPPAQCHHFEPRTIEDVLREFAFKMNDAYNDPYIGGEDRADVLSMITDDYADEIRELMGGGE